MVCPQKGTVTRQLLGWWYNLRTFTITERVMGTSLLHDLDFYAWTQQQVNLIKSGSLVDVDFKHLIEEIESMGSSERRELIN